MFIKNYNISKVDVADLTYLLFHLNAKHIHCKVQCFV
jgi:hypothetical protein